MHGLECYRHSPAGTVTEFRSSFSIGEGRTRSFQSDSFTTKWKTSQGWKTANVYFKKCIRFSFPVALLFPHTLQRKSENTKYPKPDGKAVQTEKGKHRARLQTHKNTSNTAHCEFGATEEIQSSTRRQIDVAGCELKTNTKIKENLAVK